MVRKKLLIKVSSTNCPPWIPYISGIGRSTLCLLNAIHRLDNIPFDIEVYVDGPSSLYFNFYDWKWKHHRFLIPTLFLSRIYMPLQIVWRRYIHKCDLFHIPHNWDAVYSGEKFVVTVHDTIEYEEALQKQDTMHVKQYQQMMRDSQAVMTCSQYSKKHIVELFNIPADKVHVVYWGISTDIFHVNTPEETAHQLSTLALEGKYFLSVSCWHPRKNMRTLLKAYRKFLSQGGKHKLVLVWGNPPQDLLTEYSVEIASGQLIFLSHVNDDILRALYNGASCTMFPTRAEGFGFPILESFACGTPVMTCRNTCLEEVGQDAAIYVGEDDIEGMVTIMNTFETDSYDLPNFRTRSEKIVTTFTWEKAARQYIDFYMNYLSK